MELLMAPGTSPLWAALQASGLTRARSLWLPAVIRRVPAARLLAARYLGSISVRYNKLVIKNKKLLQGGDWWFAIVSGNADNGANAGSFNLNSNNDSTNSNTNIGGALSIPNFTNPALPLGKTSDASKGRLVESQPVAPKNAES